MDTYDDSMAARFRQQLEQREQQLRALLGNPGEPAEPAGHEVADFKDLATQESQAAIDDVQLENARRELQQVMAALARIAGHTYGVCQQCGEPIDLQRLSALPATPLCIACQTLQEHRRTAAPRR
ncbi:TraR/DksA family transcriptional regulator [Caenimonas terrae]|uniref:TraR/DksA family transcriptional regulator n=1 Tax=Caenimonas terrae TaxID=696074 RepID=A0ABW0NGB2_9BURK